MLGRIFRVLTSPDKYNRVLLAINKSPIRYFSRYVVDTSHWKIKQLRRSALKLCSLTETQTMTKQLKKDGFCKIDALTDDEQLSELAAHSQALLRQKDHVESENKSKKFWIRLSDIDKHKNPLSTSNPLVKFAIQPQILSMVSSYFGEAAYLRYAILTYSQFTEADYSKSQLWHYDRDDVKMLKIFVYLSDVEQIEDGPFTFIRKQNSKKIPNTFFLSHLEDEKVYSHLPKTEIKNIYGTRLSAFAVDTSKCYHMGSRIYKGHSRLLYTALFTAAPSIYKASSNNIIIDSELSEIQRLAIQEV